MTITYGGWTLDHWISFGGIVSIIVIIHTLRLTHNFHFFAFSYSFLLLGGIFAAAVQVNTGANTAILPLLVAGCLLNGFIGGSRFVWVYAIASIALVWGLYFISVSAPPTDLSVLTVYNARIFQRAAQASLALILVSVFSAFMAGEMNQLFERDENWIEFLEVENQKK